jgi:UDP-3-O-[3-hydroxymyristoyl] N-acetylglucosamine deacetylase
MTILRTLVNGFEVSGVGLHSGVATRVRVLPGLPGEGRFFVRVDLPEQPIIRASLQAVTETVLSTQLGEGERGVRTVEHLLAALVAMGVDDARIEIDGPEVPVLDGSAGVWAEKIAAFKERSSDLFSFRGESVVTSPVSVYRGDAFVCAMPAPEMRFTYGIDFPVRAIANQWYSWQPSQESFLTAVAPARTFALAHQVEELRAQGLIKGGTLENALVCDDSGWINPPLRFANEPVRHKILDLVGDLSLLGNIPRAHYFAYKASHKLHIELGKLLPAHFSNY